MINRILEHFHINKKVALVVFVIIAALFMFFWNSNSEDVPTAAETKQEQTADESETEDSGFHFNIGWSNIAVLGGLVIALGVVKYKKELKTDKKDLKETE